jgi:CTP-dependent riboflavin kinase|tara:strand:- start:232 stop:597 length:366 start_codon:yes stop_codon:yes gene_type:complete
MFLKGKVVKGYGKATKFWSDFPEEYKLLFKEFYPGSLNVKIDREFDMIPERVMVLKYPIFLFNAEWKEAEWRSINYLPARVNGVSGFLITLDPPSIGRPKDILEFLLVDKVEDDNVKIEIL